MCLAAVQQMGITLWFEKEQTEEIISIGRKPIGIGFAGMSNQAHAFMVDPWKINIVDMPEQE
jgi:hypothetical protein